MTSSPKVRLCTPADRQAVLELAPRLTTGVAAWRDRDAVATAVRNWLVESTGPDSKAVGFVCVVDGRLAGFASVSTTAHFCGERDAYIGELAVAEEFERHGIGRRLVQAAEQWASDAGYRCITLHTGAANQGARAFYRQLGYEEEDVKLTRVLA